MILGTGRQIGFHPPNNIRDVVVLTPKKRQPRCFVGGKTSDPIVLLLTPSTGVRKVPADLYYRNTRFWSKGLRNKKKYVKFTIYEKETNIVILVHRLIHIHVACDKRISCETFNIVKLIVPCMMQCSASFPIEYSLIKIQSCLIAGIP